MLLNIYHSFLGQIMNDNWGVRPADDRLYNNLLLTHEL